MQKLSLAFSLSLAFITGCLTPTDEPAPEDNLTETEAEIGGCCQFGTARCASTGVVWEYATPRCGFGTRPNVLNECRSECGGVACIDSGWGPQSCQ